MEHIQVAALRTSKGTLQDSDLDIIEFYSTKDALGFYPDGVIICNPTALHVESALPFLERGIKVLIEKPISHTVEEAQKLEPYKELLRIAYCLRFLPIYEKLKDIFSKEKPFKVGFKRSYYLPNWHSNADYKKEYVARKDLGGGVIRTLSHEIDLAVDWFGSPVRVDGLIDKVSYLEIDTDDYAFFSLKTTQGIRVNYELDLFSPTNINRGEAFTTAGKYSWDTENLAFQDYIGKNATELHTPNTNDLNAIYVSQLKDFITFIETGISGNATYKDALTTLEIIESIEKDA